MEHFFELPVKYKEEKPSLKVRMVTFGYVYKFYVIVHGKELVFKKDDKQNYRVLSEQGLANNILTDKEMLQAIIKSLQDIKKQ